MVRYEPDDGQTQDRDLELKVEELFRLALNLSLFQPRFPVFSIWSVITNIDQPHELSVAVVNQLDK